MFEFLKPAAGGLLGRFLRDQSGATASNMRWSLPVFRSWLSEQSRLWAPRWRASTPALLTRWS